MSASFSEVLDAAVRRAGLTMAQVATRTGISPSVLSRLRTGDRAPTAEQVRLLIKHLKLAGADVAHFQDLAILARTPSEVRERLAVAEATAAEALDGRRQLERQYADERQANDWHDGWWLGYSHSFRSDGRIQRSLVKVEKDRVRMQVMEGGSLQYSYHGSFEALGDKIFIRVSEDRGDLEHVQVTLHSLFDFREPTVLYGLVCGISGRDLRRPVSFPSASRMLLLYAGAPDLPMVTVKSLQSILGAFTTKSLLPCWPEFLGSHRHLHGPLAVVDGDLDDAVMRLIDNHLAPDDYALRAELR
jgi:transcriptional regulator with XRE-family HTH domain